MATCPLPPQFPNSHLNIPPFLRSHHPYTKWMINMIRGGSHYRLTTMVRERPELFQQIFQVADQPDLIGNDARDSQSMFHRNAVLYLNPLCLAIYLKEEKSVEIILRSGVNHAYQKSYATDVFSRGVAGGDIIEILPVCVAIRREFYEAIGSLCSVAPPFMKDGQALTLDISRPLELHYESKASQKVYKFRDTLHYGTETMKTRLSINVSSLLESLITIRPELWQPQVLDDDGFGQKISLFRRIARVAYYDDPECRKSHNLISALETLFKNRCFVELQPTPDTKAGFVARIQSLDPMIMDQDCAIALLMGLYYRMHCKVKNGPMNSLADIIRRALVATKWQKTFLRLPVEHLQKIFSCVPERVALPTDSLLAIKTHINIINEKEQDSAINLTGAGRIPASELRSVGDDCALLRVRQSANRFSKPPSLSSYIQASSSGMPRRQAAAQPAPGGLETMSDFDESGMAGQEMPPSIPPPLMQQMLQQQQQQQQQKQQHQQLQQQQQMHQQLQQQLQQHRQQLMSSRSPYIGNDTADTADHEEDERSEDLNSFERELVKHMYSSTAGRQQQQQQQQQQFAASDMGDVRHQAGKPGRAGLLQQQQQQQQLFDAFDAAASSAADSAY